MEKRIHKVLVANRGEIAVRIFKTLREMGIMTTAVYSPADKDALHRRMADESLLLEGSSLAETYLNTSQIVSLAKKAGVDAIHPGYGFLSENPAFALAVKEAGLIFIGPEPDAIRLMGNKVEARELVKSLGVPLIEGATGLTSELSGYAEKIGFPVLIKAAAGGGGKGMKVVTNPEELSETLESTSREAQNYFGDGQVYLEKYLENPHHIEVQLLADTHGNVVTLFERECSIQRRYQKIIEEAPSPMIDGEMREKLMEAARKIAKKIGYTNAGTIEFLVSGQQFFFLEMNTRIQVEHPVTEMITGLDIVREQVNIASGNPIPFSQDDLKINGHAIEARVYAEDPAKDFMPSPGRLVRYQEPRLMGLRVDSALESGSEVGSEFDPMIAKVITHGQTRQEAIQKLIQGLSSFILHGVQTNITFLTQLLKTEIFASGKADTGFCNRFVLDGFSPEVNPESLEPALVAAFLFATAKLPGENQSIWNQIGFWRMQITPELKINQRIIRNRAWREGPGRISIETADKINTFSLLKKTEQELLVEDSRGVHGFTFSRGNEDSFYFQKQEQVYHVGHFRTLDKEKISELSENPQLDGELLVKAPMHGRIIKINVNVADQVSKGDTLLILESMKMENRIIATGKAKVEKIDVKAGETVTSNKTLIHLSNIN